MTSLQAGISSYTRQDYYYNLTYQNTENYQHDEGYLNVENIYYGKIGDNILQTRTTIGNIMPLVTINRLVGTTDTLDDNEISIPDIKTLYKIFMKRIPCVKNARIAVNTQFNNIVSILNNPKTLHILGLYLAVNALIIGIDASELMESEEEYNKYISEKIGIIGKF